LENWDTLGTFTKKVLFLDYNKTELKKSGTLWGHGLYVEAELNFENGIIKPVKNLYRTILQTIIYIPIGMSKKKSKFFKMSKFVFGSIRIHRLHFDILKFKINAEL